MKKVLILIICIIILCPITVFAEVPATVEDEAMKTDFNGYIQNFDNDVNTLNPLYNSIQKLKALESTGITAPIFYINMHDFNSAYDDKQIVLCDFKTMEKYSYKGFTVVEYFKYIVSALLYFQTGFIIIRKLRGVKEDV
jgi:hypothetical protein